MNETTISAVTDRSLTPEDLPLLAESLARDEYHQGTTPEFFIQPGTVCNTYSDDSGPVCFVRGSKALRLDLLFTNNNDVARNLNALLNGVSRLADKARENGFKELVVCTNNPTLASIACNGFGFVEQAGELRRVL